MKKTNTQIRHWQKGSRRVGHCGATDGSIRDVSAKAFHDSRKAPFCSVCARLAREAVAAQIVEEWQRSPASEEGEAMTERHTIHLPVIRYRDKAGNPTCAADFETGDVCKFYRTQRLSTWETCVFAETGTHSKYADNMDRRDGVQGPGMGTLIPGAWCPVWPQNDKAPGLSTEG